MDRVHESVDRAGPIHRGPAAIAVLGSSPELGLRPLRCLRAPIEGWGRGRAAGKLNGGVAVAQEVVKGRLTGGGASAREDDSEGALRAKRGSVRGVGGFTKGGVGFYMAEVRWGRAERLQWPD
jgi:hypothetical protein